MTRTTEPTRRAALATGAALVAGGAVRGIAAPPAPGGRPAPADRRFRSAAVERVIGEVTARLRGSPGAARLGLMFERCFPNTLDTTVRPGTLDGKPDTFVVTGDIDAMWLRDSSAQVWPYLSLAREDAPLRALIAGVIHRQARCVLIDPYANAFARDVTKVRAIDDGTEMKPGVFERKFEVDSLCYPLRLAHGYWRATGDLAPFDEGWRAAARTILATFRVMQRRAGPGPYRFRRQTRWTTDTAAGGDGQGLPTRPTGMIASVFRPSDDGCVFPFLVPSNLMAAAVLRDLAMLARALGEAALAAESAALAGEVAAGVAGHGVVDQPGVGRVYAYEVDGYGGRLIGDDANAPSLLSLPYFGACAPGDPVYRATRRLVLSEANPWYYAGARGHGIGSPHTGPRRAWPIAIVMRALTGDDDERLASLRQLLATDAGTGFMHEAFDVDDPAKFSRPWFAWANTLFGELVLAVVRDRPGLIGRL